MDGSTGPQRRTYLFEPRSFRPLAMVVDGPGLAGGVGGAPARRACHYHLDHLGTPRELTDAYGRIVWSARYRAYGAVLKLEHDEVDNPLRFQGQYHDVETGLHYNLFRFYDPEAGSFVNQDPIGLAGGDNVYRYVPNPVNWVDPWGLSGKCGNEIKTIDSRSVRFSQDSVKPKFKDGSSIDELAQGLKDGSIRPEQIPPVRLVEKDGQLFTLDNRRLEAFKRANMEIPYRMATPEEAAAEVWKFTTANEGISIRVRGQ